MVSAGTHHKVEGEGLRKVVRIYTRHIKHWIQRQCFVSAIYYYTHSMNNQDYSS